MPWLFCDLPCGVAVLARIDGRMSRAGRCLPYEVVFWPVSVAAISRIGRYLLSEVAVLARIGGRYEPCWPLFAVWRGCSGQYRWPL